MTEPILILGTKSPQRLALFSKFTIPFKTIHSDFDESTISKTLSPQDYVKRVAEGKGIVLEKIFPDFPILTADTTIYHDGKIINKPINLEDAFNTLSLLQNNSHQVWTGIHLRSKGCIYSLEDMTTVYLNPLTSEQISAYINTYNPIDKAGSYAIQDGASILVKKIEGDFYNVVGFSISSINHLLNKIGIDLWQYLG